MLTLVLAAVVIGCSYDFLVAQGIFVFFLVATYAYAAAHQAPWTLVLSLGLPWLYLILFKQRFATLWDRFWSHVYDRYFSQGEW